MQEPGEPTRRTSAAPSIAFWVVIAALVAGMFAYREWGGGWPGNQGADSPAVGLKVPMFEVEGLTDAQGKVELKELQGKVVLVNFWGTWCEPCRNELPHIVELYREFGSRADFRLIAVSSPSGDEPESLEELRAATAEFLAAAKVNLPTYADPTNEATNGVAMTLGEKYLRYPTTVLLDRDGVIRAAWIGYHPGVEKEMKRLILETLQSHK